MFALILSIGILVDDAIVVVENTYRHLKMRINPHHEASIQAVDEVGNPTILATFTVIAALLPMAFVSGLMGPYMRPIPVNASIAMFFSLLVAFIVIPWFCRTCYRPGVAVSGVDHEGDEQGLTARIYRRVLSPLLTHPILAYTFLGIVGSLLVGSTLLFYTRHVVVKMLPFDNKSEIQLVIDMPEGTTLEETARVTQALGRYVKTVPEVRDYHKPTSEPPRLLISADWSVTIIYGNNLTRLISRSILSRRTNGMLRVMRLLSGFALRFKRSRANTEPT